MSHLCRFEYGVCAAGHRLEEPVCLDMLRVIIFLDCYNLFYATGHNGVCESKIVDNY
jgi:hypothetical protein